MLTLYLCTLIRLRPSCTCSHSTSSHLSDPWLHPWKPTVCSGRVTDASRFEIFLNLKQSRYLLLHNKPVLPRFTSGEVQHYSKLDNTLKNNIFEISCRTSGKNQETQDVIQTGHKAELETNRTVDCSTAANIFRMISMLFSTSRAAVRQWEGPRCFTCSPCIYSRNSAPQFNII